MISHLPPASRVFRMLHHPRRQADRNGSRRFFRESTALAGGRVMLMLPPGALTFSARYEGVESGGWGFEGYGVGAVASG